jgi:hypothetical protein
MLRRLGLYAGIDRKLESLHHRNLSSFTLLLPRAEYIILDNDVQILEFLCTMYEMMIKLFKSNLTKQVCTNFIYMKKTIF